MKLTIDQQNALNEMIDFYHNDEKFHILSGSAGTGKSTLISEFITQINNYELTATTNKAVNVLSEITKKQCSTIHSLLKLQPKQDITTGKTYLYQKSKQAINASIIIIDEASMIDDEMLFFIKETGNKILFIGDSYQLAPVGSKTMPVFNDGFNISKLTKPHRQALNNPIINIANEIRQVIDGKPFPELKTCGATVNMLGHDEFERVALNHFDIGNNDNKILSWTNKASKMYSNGIRRYLLGDVTDAPYRHETYVTAKAIKERFVNGDVLINTDKDVFIEDVKEAVLYGMNGLTITLKDASNDDEESHDVFMPNDIIEANQKLLKLKNIAKKEGGKKWVDFFTLENSISDIRPAYSMTVHKSQGSTYKNVFIDLDDICKNRDCIEVARLLYVAITRPSENVYISGSYSKHIMAFNR